jgi:hypothetical protein
MTPPRTPGQPQEPTAQNAAEKPGTPPQDVTRNLDAHWIDAMLVSTNGTVMMRTKVRTHPMPNVVFVHGWPFRIRLEYFLITGKAVYSGYYPPRDREWE